MPIIRSDTLTLQVNSADQQQALVDTLGLYRRLVHNLMTVTYTHWPTVGATQGNEVVNAIEALIHPTAKRPQVRYAYFSNCYYKFPSYLRRVAIMDAVGQVRSFVTRFDQWRCGQRKHPNAKPPRLTASTKTFPSLYGSQCAKLNADASHAFIKVRWRND